MSIEIQLDLDLYKELTLTRTILGLSSLIIDEVTNQNYIFGNVESFVFSKITAAAIITPEYTRSDGSFGPIGNTGSAMNNNNFSDLCYNNFGAAGTVDLPFYTFDFGAGNPQAPSRFEISWYQVNNYVGDPFRIEASDDLNTWNTIEGGLTGTNVSSQQVDLINTTPYRYWRLFCEQGFPNGTPFMIVSEIEPQNAGTVYESIESSNDVNFFFGDDGKLNIENMNSINTNLTVRYKELNT